MEVTRRQAIVATAVAARGICLAGDIPAQERRRFGRVTVEGWMAHKRRTGKELRVIVEGRDVTTDCTFADDIRGRVIMLQRDASGHSYLGTDGRIARRLYRGTVTIVEV